MPRILATRAQQATIIRTFGRMFGSASHAVLGRMKHIDRVYELHCLISLIDGLKRRRPTLYFVLAGGSGVTLRASGGAIDRTSHAYVISVVDCYLALTAGRSARSTRDCRPPEAVL